VPISVYREATAELQATQIKLESLKVHNEQLIQQNQKLRREIDKVVNSAMQLQEALNTAQLAGQVAQPQIPSFPNSQPRVDAFTSNPYSSSGFETDSQETLSPPSPSLPFTQPRSTDADFPEHLFTEEPDESRYSRFSNSTQVSELNGIWLVVAICLIVIAAFGAGYWVVRPILQQRSR
jgi:FtsZ-binding cell division protein ZapB